KKTIAIRNLTSEAVSEELSPSTEKGLKVLLPRGLSLPAKSVRKVNVEFQFDPQDLTEAVSEWNARVIAKVNGEVVAHLPVLAIRAAASQISGKRLTPESLLLMNQSPFEAP